jgi:hypothetical protein
LLQTCLADRPILDVIKIVWVPRTASPPLISQGVGKVN